GLNVVGADIVEVAPNYDGPAQPTVNLATFVALDLMYLMYNTRKRMGINI
ncbi:MAG: agmatinase, partial [Deltaproteobacteria bacterium]|nr:agmatinase [Deltaproteobacteria bacterium]